MTGGTEVCRVAMCGRNHRQRVGAMMVMDCRQHRMDRQVLGASGPLGGVWVRDRDKVEGRRGWIRVS